MTGMSRIWNLLPSRVGPCARRGLNKQYPSTTGRCLTTGWTGAAVACFSSNLFTPTCFLIAPPSQRDRSTAFILRKRTWQSNVARASFLQQYWDCGNNAWQEEIGDHHRAGVAACVYRRAETAKGQAGWPECVGNFAINRGPGL